MEGVVYLESSLERDSLNDQLESVLFLDIERRLKLDKGALQAVVENVLSL